MAYSDIGNRKTQDIGILDERIQLQIQLDIPDGNHGISPEWKNWKVKWCKKKNSAGRKWNQLAGVPVVMDDVRFYIVYDREIDTTPSPIFRILHPLNPKVGNRMIYRVDAVNNVGDSSYFLEILATGTQVEVA